MVASNFLYLYLGVPFTPVYYLIDLLGIGSTEIYQE
uniref:Uncharacterized protein n=1 Tax=Arundo donax TaxID=35708 RepID=A0A0A9CBT3_ARUDO